MGGGGTDHVNTFHWLPLPWEIRLPSLFKSGNIILTPFFPHLKRGDRCCLVSCLFALMWDLALWWVRLLQSRKPPSLPDITLYSTLYLPCVPWHLKIDQGAVGKKLKSIWCWGVGCRKENITGQKGVGDKGFLFLNWAKKTFLLSGASWHSSCYFSPGFSFLLASQLY